MSPQALGVLAYVRALGAGLWAGRDGARLPLEADRAGGGGEAEAGGRGGGGDAGHGGVGGGATSVHRAEAGTARTPPNRARPPVRGPIMPS